MLNSPTGCSTKCGTAAGSGKPGSVVCSTSSCDANTKPDSKKCPKTAECPKPPKGTCGAPKVDWLTAPDGRAPADGWESKSLHNGGVGNRGLCVNGWNGYAGGAGVGEVSAKLKGSGKATISYRDCWKSGWVGLYINGVQKDKSGENNGVMKTFRFQEG